MLYSDSPWFPSSQHHGYPRIVGTGLTGSLHTQTSSVMTNLAARLKFMKSRSTEQALANMPPHTGNHPSDNNARTCLQDISTRATPISSSTAGVDNQMFLPRCYAHVRDHEAVDSFDMDFDIAYFYGETTQTASHGSSVSSPRSVVIGVGPQTDCYDKQVLVSLVAAQWRNSIRRRAEGFEMKERDPISATLFQRNLITLQDAMAREDIRRRDEGFELASGGRLPLVPPTYSMPSAPCSGNSRAPPKMDNIIQPSFDPPTASSVYSSDSWAGSLCVISAARSLSSACSAGVGDGDFCSRRTDASYAGSPEVHSVGDAKFIHVAANQALGL